MQQQHKNYITPEGYFPGCLFYGPTVRTVANNNYWPMGDQKRTSWNALYPEGLPQGYEQYNFRESTRCPDGKHQEPREVTSPLAYCLFCEKIFTNVDDRILHQKYWHTFTQEEHQWHDLAMIMDIEGKSGEYSFKGPRANTYKSFCSVVLPCQK